MKSSSIQLTEGSDIGNLTVDSGPSFPQNPNIAELFYLTSGATGLYVHNGSSWNLLSGSSTKMFRQTVTTTNGIWTVNLTGVSNILDVQTFILPTTPFQARFNSFQSISNSQVSGRILEVSGLGSVMMSTSSSIQVTVSITYV